jgi:hypothetical protein
VIGLSSTNASYLSTTAQQDPLQTITSSQVCSQLDTHSRLVSHILCPICPNPHLFPIMRTYHLAIILWGCLLTGLANALKYTPECSVCHSPLGPYQPMGTRQCLIQFSCDQDATHHHGNCRKSLSVYRRACPSWTPGSSHDAEWETDWCQDDHELAPCPTNHRQNSDPVGSFLSWLFRS